MKWQWNGGVERKTNLLLRECWTVLTYIFLHQQWKQCLELPVGYTILLLSAKQSRENQCNVINSLWMRRSLFANGIQYIAAKKTKTSLWNFKGLVSGCHYFCLFFIFFITYIHTFIQSFIQYIYPSPFAGASLHLLIAWKLSGKALPVVPSRETWNEKGIWEKGSAATG